MSSLKAVIAFGLFSIAQLIARHGAIIEAVGDAGSEGMALGIETQTPRGGTRRYPFQPDSTRFKGDAADTFGETVGTGDNNLETGTKAIMTETGTMLPQVKAGGVLEITLHQVNGDGGDPYTCMLNTDATGQKWTDIQVTQTPPGQNSRNRFPMKSEIPADTTCPGDIAGQQGVCLARCQNAACAGTFGGVFPFQMAGATTPAAARRGLMMAIKRSDEELASMKKGTSTLIPEGIKDLLEDGEID